MKILYKDNFFFLISAHEMDCGILDQPFIDMPMQEIICTAVKMSILGKFLIFVI